MAMKRALSAVVVSVIPAALPLPGCSTHNTTLARGDGQVIYRVSEEQAFTMTLDAFAEVLPKWSLFDITGPRDPGNATQRVAGTEPTT
jgi:hypothetical protein